MSGVEKYLVCRMLFIVFVRLFFLRNTRGDCGEVVSQAGQSSSNYMDSCEEEEEVDKRGNSSHTTSRYPCLGVDPNPQPEKENRQLTPIGLHLVLRLLRVSLDGEPYQDFSILTSALQTMIITMHF